MPPKSPDAVLTHGGLLTESQRLACHRDFRQGRADPALSRQSRAEDIAADRRRDPSSNWAAIACPISHQRRAPRPGDQALVAMSRLHYLPGLD